MLTVVRRSPKTRNALLDACTSGSTVVKQHSSVAPMRIGAVSRPWHRRLYVNASNECGTSFTRSGYRGATRIHSTARGFNSTAVRLAPKKVRGVRKIQREITIQLEQRVANTVGFLKSIPAKIAQALANFAKYMVDLFWRIVEDPTLLKTGSVAAWHAVKHFVQHMYVGAKLLGKNVSVASGLIAKSASGRKLIRREEKLLLRTVSDVGRLVPFSFFVFVPFMELLLPVALKMFPNMLPSTFEESYQRDKRYQNTVTTRLKLAQNMQEGLLQRLDVLSQSDEDADDEIKKTAREATDFKVFIEKIRDGKPIEKDSITKNARWFKDEFTLDKISRSQLEAMCSFMGIPTYGADRLLRFQIRHVLRQIQADDRKIWWEGLHALEMDDLVEANHDRGMPHSGRTREKLEQQLSRWLDLSMNSAVPPSLLILSRSFVLTTTDSDTAETGDALRAAIKSIEKEVVEEIQQELEEDVMESVEKEKKKKKKGDGVEEKTAADEAAEDLEELKREMKLIKEENQALSELEEQEKLREEELQTMQEELTHIMGSLESYNDRVATITQSMRAIAEAQKEAAALVDVKTGELTTDHVEQREDEERSERAIKMEGKMAEIQDLAQTIQNQLGKTEVSIGKTTKKLQRRQTTVSE